MIKLTKTVLRSGLADETGRPATDAAIARFFGISQSAVHQWGSDDARIPEFREMQAALKRPDLFGSIATPAANDDVGPGSEEHGDRRADAGADVEVAQGAESDVHSRPSSGSAGTVATLIRGTDQGGAR
ncbi:hypothetical protein [Luteimonas cellulosilyticus]|uniref:hypothetical protein n=1 Tax=Luteimonas cellulosilyticus TaxID=2683586 RepID=UPI001F1A919A|nr:hypothetical protein [Luteimonas cellulosilyticus]